MQAFEIANKLPGSEATRPGAAGVAARRRPWAGTGTVGPWLVAVSATAALGWEDVRRGALAALGTLLALWLRRQRVPADHVAQTAVYVRASARRT